MRLALLAAALVVSASPSPAAAQLSNHAISLESGLSAPLGSGGPAAATFALAVSGWLGGLDRGDVEGVLRVSLGSAEEAAGRAAAASLSATAGLRVSLGRAPLRPQLFADLGWTRLRGEARSDRVAYGVGAALEWFPVPDLSASVRAALRGAGGLLAGEVVLGLAAYF